MLLPQPAVKLGHFRHVALDSRVQERSYGVSLCVSGKFLWPGTCQGSLVGGPERPLGEAAKVKPRLPWKMLEVPESLDICQGKLLTNWEQNQSKRKKCCSQKGERSWDMKSAFLSSVEMQPGVCPAGFWSCFGLVFPHYACIQGHCMLDVTCFSF